MCTYIYIDIHIYVYIYIDTCIVVHRVAAVGREHGRGGGREERGQRAVRRAPDAEPASERKRNNLKGFQRFYLKAEARIWP